MIRDRLEDTGPAHDEFAENALVVRMAARMRTKLAANRHKRHWRDPEVTDAYLLERLREEVTELEYAIMAGEARWPEAADVANIAAMLADRQ
jgi:malate synthase